MALKKKGDSTKWAEASGLGTEIPVEKVDYEDHLDTPVVVPAPVVAETATASVTKTEKQGDQDEVTVQNDTTQVGQPMVIPAHKLARVEVAAGKTINLGNYESARCDVRISVPVAIEDVDDAYTFAVDWVEAKMAEMTGE